MRRVGCCLSTLYHALRRGTVPQYTTDYRVYYRYFADTAQLKYDFWQSQKGASVKFRNRDFLEKTETQIMSYTYSPYAALQVVSSDTSICVSTLYHYIKRGYFKHLRRIHCPYKCRHLKLHIQKQPKGRSIDERSIARKDFGHWEMEPVLGIRESSPCLLVFTERATRFEIVRKISGRTEMAVCTALDALEREMKGKFHKLFKTITCDNGCEFLDFSGTQKSCLRKKPRTILCFCHPYSSFVRGSNENANRMIRRFIPKGKSMTDCPVEKVQAVNDWLSNYPRKLFSGKSAQEMFRKKISQRF